MKDRFLKIRKKAGITQEAFASRIGLTKNFVSLIETGKREPSDRTIKDICREFDINEEWLRDGVGEMFVPLTRSESIAKFAGGLMKESDDSFKKQLVEVLAELDENEWEVLEGIAKKLAKKD